MLIAFNAHLLTGDASYRSAGISVYIANLLRYLSQQHAPEDDLDYAVLMGEGQLLSDCEMRVIRATWPTARPAGRVAWEQAILPGMLRRLNADLLHAPAFVGPLVAPCPQVITLHDLSFFRHPAFFKRANRLYLRMMTPLACRRAAAVIAVSEFTAREAVALLSIAPERVHVITHGVDPRFRPLPPEEVARFRVAQGLPERFILHMGTLEPRKNLVRLVRAFAQGAPSDVHLVLAGGRGWLYEMIFTEVARLGVQDRVHFPGYVPAETQALWYNAADLFAYVSIYEGFGLPVLEALACGTPTLTSGTTSLPEAAGDAALTVPPDDVPAIAAGLARLLADDILRADLHQRGLVHAARFAWETTARRTAALYQRILGGEEQ